MKFKDSDTFTVLIFIGFIVVVVWGAVATVRFAQEKANRFSEVYQERVP